MKLGGWSGLLSLLAAMSLTLPAPFASAAQIKSEKLKNSDQQFISIVGEIREGDLARFRRLAVSYDDAVVFLASPGGLTLEAMEIGKIVRIKGYYTFVAAGSDCRSACALIWLAGQKRYMEKGARVGFHAAYLEENGRKTESGVGNAVVGNYLTQLSLGQNAIVFATSAGPDKLNWLTLENASSVGIEVSSLPGEDRAAKTEDAEDGSVRIFRQVGRWTVGIDESLGGGCFLLGDYQHRAFRIGLDARQKTRGYLMLLGDSWNSIKPHETYPVEVTFGSAAPWKTAAAGIQMGDAKGLFIPFEKAFVFESMSKAQELRVRYRDAEIAHLMLENSSQALDAMAECQNAQKAERDPFAH